MMKKTKSFVFYESFKNGIKRLPIEKQLEALWCVIDYGIEGENNASDDLIEMVMEFIIPQIDANTRRRNNGAKGGRPPKKDNLETTGYSEKNHRLLDDKPLVIESKTIGYEDENHRLLDGKPNVNVNVNVNDNKEKEKLSLSVNPKTEEKQKPPIATFNSFMDYFNSLPDDVKKVMNETSQFFGINAKDNARKMIDFRNFFDHLIENDQIKYYANQLHNYKKCIKLGHLVCKPDTWFGQHPHYDGKWNERGYQALYDHMMKQDTPQTRKARENEFWNGMGEGGSEQ